MRRSASLAALLVLVAAAGACSSQQPAADSSSSAAPQSQAPVNSATPGAPGDVMEVDYGVDEITVALGQSVDFRAPGPAVWEAASSDDGVFRVVPASEDPFTPDTPGGVAVTAGTAMVTMSLPTGGTPWEVKVTVIDTGGSP